MADSSALPQMLQTYLLPSSITKKSHSKLSQNQVVMHFKKINSIIDTIDEHITQKIDSHEMEMLAIVKKQIDQMKSETKTMVEKLNNMINAKNEGEELWNLYNELQYFKNQSHALFKQNKQLRAQISRLGKNMAQIRMQVEEKDEVLHKLKRTCMRENLSKTKHGRQKHQDIGAVQIEKEHSMNYSLNLKIQSKTKRNFMTEPDQSKKQEPQPLKLIQSKINIRVSRHKDLTPLPLPEDYAKINQNITIPSLCMHQHALHAPSQIKMKWVDSCLVDSQAKTSIKRLDQAVQTELAQPTGKKQASNKKAVLQIAEPSLNRYTTSLDLSKNGFVTTKKKSPKIKSSNSQAANYCQDTFCQQDRNNKLINNTINRNKIKKSLHQMINKSSLK